MKSQVCSQSCGGPTGLFTAMLSRLHTVSFSRVQAITLTLNLPEQSGQLARLSIAAMRCLAVCQRACRVSHRSKLTSVLGAWLLGLPLLAGSVPVGNMICDPAVYGPDSQECRASRLRATDEGVLFSFKDALSTYETNARRQFSKQHRAWIAGRNTECGIQSMGGNPDAWSNALAKDRSKTDCTLRRNEARIAELKQQLAEAIAVRRYRMTEGMGYSVCEAHWKNLNAFPASDPPMVCELKIHPTHPEFSLPQWEPLDIYSNLPLIYEAVMLLSPYTQRDVEHPAFENWRQEFLAKIEKKELVPRLQRTRLALNERGVETLILYASDTNECERYKASAGGNIFVLRDGDHPEPIDGIPGSGNSMSVLLYHGKTFFISTGSEGFTSWSSGLFAVSPRLSGRQQYILRKRCNFRFEK